VNLRVKDLIGKITDVSWDVITSEKLGNLRAEVVTVSLQ